MSRMTRNGVGTLALLGLLIIALATLAGCGGQPAAQPAAVAQVADRCPTHRGPARACGNGHPTDASA